VRFNVLMTVITRSVVFLDAMPCSLVGRYNIWKEPTSSNFRVTKSFYLEQRGSRFLQNMVPMY